jgi:diguanylate cyclase (GGDEF)-like protein
VNPGPGDLDGCLEHVRRTWGADLVLVWEDRGPQGAAVVAAAPVGVAEHGTLWPGGGDRPEPDGQLSDDPLVLASRVPTSVRLRLAARPRSLVERRLADGLVVLGVWGSEDPSPDGAALDVADGARLAALAAVRSRVLQAEADAVRLGAVVTALDQAIVIVDDASGSARLNAAGGRLLGLDEGELPARDVAAALRALRERSLDAEALAARAARLLGTSDAVVSGWIWHFDGRPSHLRVTSTPLRGAGLSGRVWVFDDVSAEMSLLEQEKAARLAAEEATTALAESERRYRDAVEVLRTTFDALMDPALLMVAERRADGTIVELRCAAANTAASAEHGLDGDDIVGKALAELSTGPVEGMRRVCVDVIEGDRPIVMSAIEAPAGILEPGRRYDLRVVRAADGVVVSWRDVTDRWSAEQALERRARHDELTGLPNRAEVIERLARRLAGASDARPGGHVALLFCDLDRFKDVNDTWGHAAGDAVLRAVARRAIASLRAGDIFGRLGGDELVAVLEGVDDLEHAVLIAKRLHGQLAGPVDWEGTTIPLGISMGVVLARADEAIDDLLIRADQAMYRAKQAGRDRVIPIG